MKRPADPEEIDERVPLADDEAARGLYLPAADLEVQSPAREEDRERQIEVRDPAQCSVEFARHLDGSQEHELLNGSERTHGPPERS